MRAQQRIVDQGDDDDNDFSFDLIQCHEITSTSPPQSSFCVNVSHRSRCRQFCTPVYIPSNPNNRNPFISRHTNPFSTMNRTAEEPTPLLLQPARFPAPRKSVHEDKVSTRYAVISVAFIFLLSLLALLLVYSYFPNVTEEEKQYIKIPWNIQDAKRLGLVLNRYKTDHYYEVMTGVFAVYVFLQTFAIPGSLFLSILSGFLFPFSLALVLVCTCSALGASLCFMLSQLLGRRLVLKYFPDRARKWAEQVEKHHDELTNYIIFLRVTPFLPNWFINLSAPVIGVPLVPFALGTFIGVAPPSFIAIQGGQTLHTMTESDAAFKLSSFIWLVVFGIISLLPIIFKNKFKQKLE